MFEAYPAEIAYIEGAFTWIAKRGDVVHVVEAIDPPRMFSYERGEHELEYSIGDYMDPDDVHAAFGIDPPGRPEGIHPAQPYEPRTLFPGARQGPARSSRAWRSSACFWFSCSAAAGRSCATIRPERPAPRPSPSPSTIRASCWSSNSPAPVSNSWVYYEVTVSDAETGEPVLGLGQEISFYFGRDSDGRWTEGSQSGSALFKVPAAGDYEIEIDPAEAGGSVPPLTASLSEQVMVKRYVVAPADPLGGRRSSAAFPPSPLREEALGGRAGRRRGRRRLGLGR